MKPCLSIQNIKLSCFPEAKWTPSCCQRIVLTDSRAGFAETISATWSASKEWLLTNPALKHLERGLLGGAVSPDF